MTANVTTASAKYSRVAIALHWVLAILILFLLFPARN